MIEKKIGSSRVYIFDSIHELPAERHHEFTKYSLLDIGVGTDMKSIGEHNRKVDTYLIHGKNEDAIQERKTQDLNYWYAINKISFKSYSFACMVQRINDEWLNDFTIDSLDSVIKKLVKLGIKNSDVQGTIDDIKKNLIESLGLTSLSDFQTMTSLAT